jgi:hypothetical protein
MILQESSWWMVFTAVCLVSLVGLLEYEGVINMIGESNAEPLDEKEEDTPVEPLNSSADEMHPLGEICLGDHGNISMHFHPYLTILIDGDEYSISENTGIDTTTCPEAMHMTHTHTPDGKIHVEGHTAEEVPLEVFFDVWGMHFDETGIFDNRDGSIEMTVNGEVNSDYQNLLLADGQNIVISYTSN